MHLCFHCRDYPPARHGGVGTFTQALGRSLVNKGHQVSCVGLYPSPHPASENDQGVNVIRRTASSVPYLGYYFNRRRQSQLLWDLHQRSPIDLIDGPELSLSLVPRDFPAVKIIRMHGGHHFFSTTLGSKPNRMRGWLEKQSFAKADHICAVSRFVAETTRDLLQLGDRPIEIIYNPVNTEMFRPRDDIPEQEGAMLFVGALREKKGIRQLVLALPKIVEAVPYAKLWVAGRDTVDPETNRSFLEKLRGLIPPGLLDNIEFLGAVEHETDLPIYIAKAQVCVYPSHMEALSLVFLEGIAAGKAVVAPLAGPGPEAIENEVSGLLCDPHSPNSIAKAVIRCLQDDKLRTRLGTAARQRAEKLFAVDVIVQKNLAFYEKCLNVITSNL